MSDGQRNLIATRGAQMFPRLTDDELARLSRFGEPRRYREGEMVARLGEAGSGLMLILSGQVEVTERAAASGRTSSPTSAAISWESLPSCPEGPSWSTPRR